MYATTNKINKFVCADYAFCVKLGWAWSMLLCVFLRLCVDMLYPRITCASDAGYMSCRATCSYSETLAVWLDLWVYSAEEQRQCRHGAVRQQKYSEVNSDRTAKQLRKVARVEVNWMIHYPAGLILKFLWRKVIALFSTLIFLFSIQQVDQMELESRQNKKVNWMKVNWWG